MLTAFDKGDGGLRPIQKTTAGRDVKYAWIKEHRDQFPVTDMCRLMGVSRSGFYASLSRQQSDRAKRSVRIVESVAKVHQEADEIC